MTKIPPVLPYLWRMRRGCSFSRKRRSTFSKCCVSVVVEVGPVSNPVAFITVHVVPINLWIRFFATGGTSVAKMIVETVTFALACVLIAGAMVEAGTIVWAVNGDDDCSDKEQPK